jgi:hypothetical protein
VLVLEKSFSTARQIQLMADCGVTFQIENSMQTKKGPQWQAKRSFYFTALRDSGPNLRSALGCRLRAAIKRPDHGHNDPCDPVTKGRNPQQVFAAIGAGIAYLVFLGLFLRL